MTWKNLVKFRQSCSRKGICSSAIPLIVIYVSMSIIYLGSVAVMERNTIRRAKALIDQREYILTEKNTDDVLHNMENISYWTKVIYILLVIAGGIHVGIQSLVSLGILEKKINEGLKDKLTGCFNREAWESSLDKNIFTRNTCCIVMIDLDDFKNINDQFGHQAGDKVLERTGKTIHSITRNEDFVFKFNHIAGESLFPNSVYRLGGDEFLIVIPTEIDISKEIEQRLEVNFVESGINSSVGTAMSWADQDVLQAVKEADIKMLENKRNKKLPIRNLEINKGSRKTLTNNELSILANLEIGLSKEQLFMLYQPITDKEKNIVAIESLIRWVNQVEYISPSIFIPIAERTGQIEKIWKFTLNEVAKQLKKMQEMGLRSNKIGINFSSCHIEYAINSGHSYADEIKKICAKNQVNPSSIYLELTETAFVSDIDAALSLFEELRKIGVTLCIDDFGTGYTSLQILSEFPVCAMKIDGSFINRMLERKEDKTLVKSSITLAKDLSIISVAECIETNEQFQKLVKMGCETFQGYSIYHPMSGEETIKLLKLKEKETKYKKKTIDEAISLKA